MFKIYDVIIPVGIGCTVSFQLKKTEYANVHYRLIGYME